MAKSISERVKKWRQKRRDYKRIDILIDPETARRLDRLKVKHNQSIGAIFSEALKCLEAQEGKKGG